MEVRAGDRHPSCLLSHLLRGQQRSTLVCMGWGGEEVFQRFLSERDSQGLCPSGWVTASPLEPAEDKSSQRELSGSID